MKEALQWWYKRKLTQLKSEANVIREQLLQESFAMRRNLELSPIKSGKFAACHQRYVEQLEDFHSSLKELSDRLYPSYIEAGLPAALQYSVEQWQKQLPHFQFELSLPQNWRSPNSTDSSIVLDILKDLLRIKEGKTLFNNLIFIALEQNTSSCSTNNQLKVMFLGKKVNDIAINSDRTELQYLQQTFESLTSGSCSNILTEDSDVWLFNW